MQIVTYKPGEPNEKLDQIRSRAVRMDPDLVTQVEAIVEGVRSGGDEALVRYTYEFDGVKLDPEQLLLGGDYIKHVAARVDNETLAAFKHAIGNVREFSRRQVESGWRMGIGDGCHVGQRIVPVESAGVYAP